LQMKGKIREKRSRVSGGPAQPVEQDASGGRGHDKGPRAATQTGRMRQGSGSWIGSSSAGYDQNYMRLFRKGKHPSMQHHVRQKAACQGALSAVPRAAAGQADAQLHPRKGYNISQVKGCLAAAIGVFLRA
jgi:hypothetical protein